MAPSADRRATRWDPGERRSSDSRMRRSARECSTSAPVWTRKNSWAFGSWIPYIADPARLLGGDLGEDRLIRVEGGEGAGGSRRGQALVRGEQSLGRRVDPGARGGSAADAEALGEIEPELGVRGVASLLVHQILEQHAPLGGVPQLGVGRRDVAREVRFKV